MKVEPVTIIRNQNRHVETWATFHDGAIKLRANQYVTYNDIRGCFEQARRPGPLTRRYPSPALPRVASSGLASVGTRRSSSCTGRNGGRSSCPRRSESGGLVRLPALALVWLLCMSVPITPDMAAMVITEIMGPVRTRHTFGCPRAHPSMGRDSRYPSRVGYRMNNVDLLGWLTRARSGGPSSARRPSPAEGAAS